MFPKSLWFAKVCRAGGEQGGDVPGRKHSVGNLGPTWGYQDHGAWHQSLTKVSIIPHLPGCWLSLRVSPMLPAPGWGCPKLLLPSGQVVAQSPNSEGHGSPDSLSFLPPFFFFQTLWFDLHQRLSDSESTACTVSVWPCWPSPSPPGCPCMGTEGGHRVCQVSHALCPLSSTSSWCGTR